MTDNVEMPLLTTIDGVASLDGIAVDFDNIEMRLIKKSAHNANQPVVKAIGKQTEIIIDLTCGYGKDSYLFLCTGRRVVGVERNPLVFELLSNGVQRAMQNPEHAEVFDRFKLINAEAMDFVNKLEEDDYPDVYYIDPMYPPRNTSALPKKDIQVLRKLLKDDLNEDPGIRETKLIGLIELCLSKTKRRVVLKRPVWLEPLFKPKISFQGKLVRYDVYVKE